MAYAPKLPMAKRQWRNRLTDSDSWQKNRPSLSGQRSLVALPPIGRTYSQAVKGYKPT